MSEATGSDVIEEVLASRTTEQHFGRTPQLGRVDIPDDVGEDLQAFQLVRAWRGVTFDPRAHRAAIDTGRPSDLLTGEARPTSDLIAKALHFLAHRARRTCVRDATFGGADVRLPELTGPAHDRTRHPLGSGEQIIELGNDKRHPKSGRRRGSSLKKRVCDREDRPWSSHVHLVVAVCWPRLQLWTHCSAPNSSRNVSVTAHRKNV